MSQWPSTQLSEGGRPLTAENLLKDVKQLIDGPQLGSDPVTNRDPYTEGTKQFTEIILSLSDMLTSFPKMEGGASKHDLDRAVDLARLSLDAIDRISTRKEGVLSGEEKDLTRKLVTFVATVDGWIVRGGPEENMRDLREQILLVLNKGFRHRVEETFIPGLKFENGILVTNICLKEILSSVRCEYSASHPMVADSTRCYNMRYGGLSVVPYVI